MFINELAQTFFRFEKFKLTLSKVSHNQKKTLETLNQDIFITDLVLRAPFEPFGEADFHTNRYKNPQECRIRTYIAALFDFTNEYHHTNYCEMDSGGNYKLKKDKENHVTRLTTHEFSFYTKYPLTLNEFQMLIQDIENMANNLTPNVHVLLSSFAVRNHDGILINMSVFVEGGNPSTLHVFAKNTSSGKDIHYEGQATLFSQQQQDKNASFHAEAVISKDNMTISTGSVFEVKTKGGACYTQAIDICLDHKYQHSKELMARRIHSPADPDQFLPQQIEHCISSNSIYLFEDSLISDGFIHADPSYSMQHYYEENFGPKVLTDKTIERIIPSSYQKMKIIEYSGGYNILNPPFGSDSYIEVFNERPAGKYKPELQAAVHQHNNEVCERRLAFLKQEYLDQMVKDKIVQHIDQSKMLSVRIEQLEKKMLTRCKPTVFNGLFITEEYKQKMEAKEIITSSMKLIKEALHSQGNLCVLLLPSWKKDLESKLNYVGSCALQSPLKNALKKDIKEIIDNKLQNDLGCEFESNHLISRNTN